MQKTPSYHYIQTPAQTSHLFRGFPQVAVEQSSQRTTKHENEWRGGGAGSLGRTLGKEDTYVIRSFLSFSFLRPPKAILVPGMYFLGFSR